MRYDLTYGTKIDIKCHNFPYSVSNLVDSCVSGPQLVTECQHDDQETSDIDTAQPDTVDTMGLMSGDHHT